MHESTKTLVGQALAAGGHRPGTMETERYPSEKWIPPRCAMAIVATGSRKILEFGALGVSSQTTSGRFRSSTEVYGRRSATGYPDSVRIPSAWLCQCTGRPASA